MAYGRRDTARATCTADQLLIPRAVGVPRSVRARAMPASDVMPAWRSSWIIGARSVALALVLSALGLRVQPSRAGASRECAVGGDCAAIVPVIGTLAFRQAWHAKDHRASLLCIRSDSEKVKRRSDLLIFLDFRGAAGQD
jgi:hypothetical protein